jgi:hypothetical protein
MTVPLNTTPDYLTMSVADGWKTSPLKTIAEYLLIFYPKNQNSELTTIQRITSFDLKYNKPILNTLNYLRY